MENPKNPIIWDSRIVPLATLKPYEHNPRSMTKDAYEKLKQSITQDGYHQRLIANSDMTIVGGHQRLRALKELGFTEVEVLVPSRPLTPEEFDRINVRDNIPFGDWDFDILANRFDTDTLLDWGMPEAWLPDTKGLGAGDESGAEESPPLVCPNCGHVLGSEEKTNVKG